MHRHFCATRTLCFVLLFCVAVFPVAAMDHEEGPIDSSPAMPAMTPADASAPMAHQHDPAAAAAVESAGLVGLEEKLGEHIPLDIPFVDEEGQARTLGALIQGPTVIVPIYYRCPNVCNFLQGSLAEALRGVKLTPGDDFRVISISFDETETPETAKRSQEGYLNVVGPTFPATAWSFLTGDLDSIHRFTDAIGFHFLRQNRDFQHPVTLVVVSRDGTVIRYLPGTQVLPMDLSLALVEASEGRVSTPIRKMLTFCFSYDPESRRYVFNLLRVTATTVLLCAGGLLAYLLLSGRRTKKDKTTP